jgi:putative oxidoreductase
MFDSNRNLIALVGRIALALIFITAGYSKIGTFQGTVGYIQSVGLPLPQLAAAVAIVVELVGGIALLIGYKARWAALALAVFCLVTALFFHNYWAMPPEKQMIQSILFWKNIAIMGGLLMVTAFGPGAWSVDGRK